VDSSSIGPTNSSSTSSSVAMAGCAAVFIDDQREVEFALEKQGEELLEAGGFRDEDDFARPRSE